MTVEITPSFIQACITHKKLSTTLVETHLSKEGIERLKAPLEAPILDFKSNPWEEKWNEFVESTYSEFRQKHPFYPVDKSIFGEALARHPQGRAVLKSLQPTEQTIEKYFDKVYAEIKLVEQDQILK